MSKRPIFIDNTLLSLAMQTVRKLGAFSALVIILAFAFASASSKAKDLSNNSSYGEIWKKSKELKDQQSFDTTLVEFTYDGTKYRVPRNYLSVLPNNALRPVTFRVTFPGFEPLTEKTKQCLTQPRLYWPAGCTPVEFWLEGHAAGTDDQHFTSETKPYPLPLKQQISGGLELYQYGSGVKRRDIYRKKTTRHTLIIDCNYFSGYQDKPDAVCSNYRSPLPNSNSLSYRLDLDQIPHAEQIDDGIRALIESFTVIKGDK